MNVVGSGHIQDTLELTRLPQSLKAGLRGWRERFRMILSFLVQAAGVRDGGITETGEPMGRREVRSSVLDTLSAGCRLHLSDP